VLNAANEVAVREFAGQRLGFTGIPSLVEATLEAVERAGITAEPGSLEEAVAIDQAGRSAAAALLPEIAAKSS
jgi:1-deoxy-D-xylulose-5-phosphate reductoisomerase